MSEIRMVVGLGNPGSRYEWTRHNIGFIAVDLFEREFGSGWKNWSGMAEVARSSQGLILAKPQKYMNLSGQVVRQLADFYKIAPQEILVVVDDFSIPLGTMRLRRNGSAGGHNGLSSIIEHLGTSEYPRLRLGIGPLPERMSSPDFVLGAFTPSERTEVERVAAKSVQVIRELIESGWDKALNTASSQKQ